MNKLYLIVCIFLSSCGDPYCVDDVCPYEHKACPNCDRE